MRLRRRWVLGGALSLGLLAGGVGVVMATDGDEDDTAEQLPAGSDREQAEAAALAATGGGTVTSAETGDDGGAFGVEIQSTGGDVEVTLDQAFAVLGVESDSGDGSGTDSDSDELAPGAEYDQAVAAALAETGGGTITDVETGDDGAVYGVEVLREDGTEVEVQIDGSFTATGSEVDD